MCVNSWRDEVVGKLETALGRVILVADPDDLLIEEGMLQRVAALGFDLLTFDDHVAFRFAFESGSQSLAEPCADAITRTLIRVSEPDLGALPYDLLARGQRLSFGLAKLFPQLSYPVVASLDRTHLDALFAAQQHAPPACRLGDRETREYVLRHVFGVAPETITREEHLLRFLIGRHYRGQRIPVEFDRQLMRLLEERPRFREWPLASIVPDREAFFAFLQERWPPFLDRLAVPSADREEPPSEEYEIHIPGPVQIAFDHGDVRIYIDNLFHDGLLKPVRYPKSRLLAGSWAMVGITTDPSADRLRRIRGLLDAVADSVPCEGAAHRQWLDFARRWAELRVLKGTASDAGMDANTTARYDEVRERVDEGFAAWLAARYSMLHSHPPVPPVMVHHVPPGSSPTRAPRTGPQGRARPS